MSENVPQKKRVEQCETLLCGSPAVAMVSFVPYASLKGRKCFNCIRINHYPRVSYFISQCCGAHVILMKEPEAYYKCPSCNSVCEVEFKDNNG